MFNTYTQMSDISKPAYIFSKIYLYVFISLFIYVVLNVFISLISDTYHTLHVSHVTVALYHVTYLGNLLMHSYAHRKSGQSDHVVYCKTLPMTLL